MLVPLNYRLSGRELDYLLSDSKPSAMLFAEKHQSLVAGQKHFEALEDRFALEAFQAMLASPHQKFNMDKEGVVAVPGGHPLFILYTSGTTGFPKGALYTHRMAFWNSVNTALRLNITSEDHTLVCMPPFHTGGWNVLLTPFLHHGASVSLLPKFEAEQVLEVLERKNITVFMAVPTMLKMIAQTPGFAEREMGCLRYLLVGGEPMPIPLIEQWHGKDIPIRQGFGMTEAGPNLFSLHQDDAIRKMGSIGKPNFYVEVKLVDTSGREVPVGETGELLIRGPVVTPGYWQNPEATARSFDQDWFFSGDLLRKDDEGFYYVLDRKKNMFISGGENVYPAEVEHFIRTYPDIAEVAVVAVPDEKWGEVGKAFVVLKAGTMATAEEIMAYCRTGLAKYKVPKHIAFLNELPKNPTGKIDHRKLAETANGC